MIKRNRRFILAFIVFVLSYFGGSSVLVMAQDTEYVFSAGMINEMPQFKEPGVKDYSEWVKTHLVYPESAKANKREAIVSVSFIVETDGSISDIRVGGFREVGGTFDYKIDNELREEALRVVSCSPTSWHPGRRLNDNNELVAVRVQWGVDVEYSLTDPNNRIYDKIDVNPYPPTFKGKDEREFAQWVKSNISIPAGTKERGMKGGTLWLYIVVNTDGLVIDANVREGLDPELDKEVTRVALSSPKWKPGIRLKDNSPVKVRIPVKLEFPSIAASYSMTSSGAQTSAQQSNSQTNVAANTNRKGTAAVWASDSGGYVFTLYKDETADVKFVQFDYSTHWTVEQGVIFIGGIGNMKAILIYENGDLFTLSRNDEINQVYTYTRVNGVRTAVGIKVHKR